MPPAGFVFFFVQMAAPRIRHTLRVRSEAYRGGTNGVRIASYRAARQVVGGHGRGMMSRLFRARLLRAVEMTKHSDEARKTPTTRSFSPRARDSVRVGLEDCTRTYANDSYVYYVFAYERDGEQTQTN